MLLAQQIAPGQAKLSPSMHAFPVSIARGGCNCLMSRSVHALQRVRESRQVNFASCPRCTLEVLAVTHISSFSISSRKLCERYSPLRAFLCHTAALPPTIIWLMGCSTREPYHALAQQCCLHHLSRGISQAQSQVQVMTGQKMEAHDEDELDKEADEAHHDKAQCCLQADLIELCKAHESLSSPQVRGSIYVTHTI